MSIWIYSKGKFSNRKESVIYYPGSLQYNRYWIQAYGPIEYYEWFEALRPDSSGQSSRYHWKRNKSRLSKRRGLDRIGCKKMLIFSWGSEGCPCWLGCDFSRQGKASSCRRWWRGWWKPEKERRRTDIRFQSSWCTGYASSFVRSPRYCREKESRVIFWHWRRSLEHPWFWAA